MIEILKRKIESNDYSEGIIYLLETIDDRSGFFYLNNHLLYIEENNGLKHKQFKTLKLSCFTNVYIEKFKNAIQFSDGYYDMIELIDDIYSPDAECFIQLCNSYNKSQIKGNIYDFFVLISSIFKNETKQMRINLIGMLGELFLIREVYSSYKKNLCNGWHYSSEFSKYDFRYNSKNIEVKTTTKSSMVIHIKHDQLFLNKNIYLITVRLEEAYDGKSLKELIDYFCKTAPFCNDFDFVLKLQRELRRVDFIGGVNKKYALSEIKAFNCDSLSTITKIPLPVSNLIYNYDFSEQETIELENLFL